MAELTQNGGVVRVTGVHRPTKISFETARVISKATIHAGQRASDAAHGSEIDRHVSKGAASYEATPNPRRKGDVTATNSRGWNDYWAIMRDVCPISAERSWAAVKDWRVLRCAGILRPVPVLKQWLV